MTPEELQEIERLAREATPGPWNDVRIGMVGDGSARSHEEQLCNADGVAVAIMTHDGSEQAVQNTMFIARARTLLPRLVADYRAAIELAEHIQADLAAATRANARAEATIADLREDLARARQVNEQAEKVRDENDRLRRDLATVRLELQALHDVLSGARAVTAAEGRAEK